MLAATAAAPNPLRIHESAKSSLLLSFSLDPIPSTHLPSHQRRADSFFKSQEHVSRFLALCSKLGLAGALAAFTPEEGGGDGAHERLMVSYGGSAGSPGGPEDGGGDSYLWRLPAPRDEVGGNVGGGGGGGGRALDFSDAGGGGGAGPQGSLAPGPSVSLAQGSVLSAGGGSVESDGISGVGGRRAHFAPHQSSASGVFESAPDLLSSGLEQPSAATASATASATTSVTSPPRALAGHAAGSPSGGGGGGGGGSGGGSGAKRGTSGGGYALPVKKAVKYGNPLDAPEERARRAEVAALGKRHVVHRPNSPERAFLARAAAWAAAKDVRAAAAESKAAAARKALKDSTAEARKRVKIIANMVLGPLPWRSCLCLFFTLLPPKTMTTPC